MGLTQAVRLSLQQFSEVFQIRDAANRPYILVGGQAVNYWSERYLATEPELQKLIPFTSEDIDFKGTRTDVERIAGQLKRTPVFPSKVMMTALSGAVPIQVGRVKTNIEVVRTIPGVAATAVDALAVEAEWAGRQIRVLDPISLLACKLELALTISQEKRQDLGHLKMLIPCVRGFLRELLNEVERERLPAKGWLGAVTKVFELSKSTHGRKAAARFKLDWQAILPRPEITASKQPKIVQFREKQLTRWIYS
jgi:hypothetical protein